MLASISNLGVVVHRAQFVRTTIIPQTRARPKCLFSRACFNAAKFPKPL